ncbi:hypothetical protein DXG01_014836 [Tephrocybe rancida]|nr:hypothetical protein DXG01_014836 [Tephrocybe rancida]
MREEDVILPLSRGAVELRSDIQEVGFDRARMGVLSDDQLTSTFVNTADVLGDAFSKWSPGQPGVAPDVAQAEQGYASAELMEAYGTQALTDDRQTRTYFRENDYGLAAPGAEDCHHRLLVQQDYPFLATQRPLSENVDQTLPQFEGTSRMIIGSPASFFSRNFFLMLLYYCPRWAELFKVYITLMEAWVIKSPSMFPSGVIDLHAILWTLHEASRIVSERVAGYAYNLRDRCLGFNTDWSGPEVLAYMRIEWPLNCRLSHLGDEILLILNLGSVSRPAPMILVYSLAVSGRVDLSIFLANFGGLFPGVALRFTGQLLYEVMHDTCLPLFRHTHMIISGRRAVPPFSLPGLGFIPTSHPPLEENFMLPLTVLANISAIINFLAVTHYFPNSIDGCIPTEAPAMEPVDIAVFQAFQEESREVALAFLHNADDRSTGLRRLQPMWFSGKLGSAIEWRPIASRRLPTDVFGPLLPTFAALPFGPHQDGVLPVSAVPSSKI